MTTLLVAEDDTAIAAALRELLEREGYSVITVGTIAAAQRALASSTIDGMLLDWRLPDGEGIDLLREIRKTSELPILLVTGRVDVVDRVVGLELGADDYITKPIEPRELLARLKTRLRHAQRTPAVERRLLRHAELSMDPSHSSVAGVAQVRRLTPRSHHWRPRSRRVARDETHSS